MAAKVPLRLRMLTALALLVSTLMCSWSERASAAEEVRVTAKKEGQAITVDVRFNVKAAQRQAWDVLVDFDRMPDYVPTLESSKVVHRSDNNLQVAQRGKETYGPFSFSFDNLREVELKP